MQGLQETESPSLLHQALAAHLPLRDQYPKVTRPFWTAAPDLTTYLHRPSSTFEKQNTLEKAVIQLPGLLAVSSFHPFRLLSPLPSYFLSVVLIIFLNPWLHLFFASQTSLSGLNSNLNIEAHWKRRCTQWNQLHRTDSLFLHCKNTLQVNF